ncbi:hypothetical protein ACRTEC_13320 [Janibacter indicus]
MYNYEQIELLEPDLILNVRAAGDDKVFDRLSKIAPVVAAPKDAAAEHPEFKDKTFAYGVKFCEACGSYVEGDARFAVFGELGFVENPALSKLIPSSGFFAAVAAEQVKAFDADVAMLSTIALAVEEVTPDLAKAK